MIDGSVWGRFTVEVTKIQLILITSNEIRKFLKNIPIQIKSLFSVLWLNCKNFNWLKSKKFTNYFK